MNIVLLITVTFTFALGLNNKPCLRNNNNNAYNEFVRKHILQEWFDRASVPAWEKYIRKKGLCNRPLQSFFESSDQGKVTEICNGRGHPMFCSRRGNLCISDLEILVNEIIVYGECKVRFPKTKNKRKKVIVACDRIDNLCLPVHFEKYTKNINQIPNMAEVCIPPRSISLEVSWKAAA